MAICFSCVKSALFNSLMEEVMSTDNFHFLCCLLSVCYMLQGALPKRIKSDRSRSPAKAE